MFARLERRVKTRPTTSVATGRPELGDALLERAFDLLEGIALHALENKPPFKRLTLEKIAQLRRVYGFDLVAADSHRLREQEGSSG